MPVSADVMRAFAHGLLDVTAVSGVLACAAYALGRARGLGAATRSLWWSAVAIVPLLAFVCALGQPLLVPSTAPGDAYAGRTAVLVDPLDTLLRASGNSARSEEHTS